MSVTSNDFEQASVDRPVVVASLASRNSSEIFPSSVWGSADFKKETAIQTHKTDKR